MTKIMLFLACSSTLANAAGSTNLISLNNTNFVVSLAFIAFVILLIYFKVPPKIAMLLDNRADAIRAEIDTANKVLEDSKTLLAELEREHKNNIQKAERIITEAEAEAKRLIDQSKKDVRTAIERKIKIAEDQIKSAESAVIKRIKDQAVDESIKLSEEKLLNFSNSSANKAFLTNAMKEITSKLN